jgi:hypothetical protein
VSANSTAASTPPRRWHEIDQIQRVVDELEILRLLATLAQALDDRDEARYRACLGREALHHTGSASPRRPQRRLPEESLRKREEVAEAAQHRTVEIEGAWWRLSFQGR